MPLNSSAFRGDDPANRAKALVFTAVAIPTVNQDLLNAHDALTVCDLAQMRETVEWSLKEANLPEESRKTAKLMLAIIEHWAIIKGDLADLKRLLEESVVEIR